MLLNENRTEQKPLSVAILGKLPSVLPHLRRWGVDDITHWEDGLDVADLMMCGKKDFYLVLVRVDVGEGLFPLTHHVHDGRSCHVRLIQEPICSSAVSELEFLLKRIYEEETL